MNLRKFRNIIIITISIVLSPISLYSQFTYIDVSLGNKIMKVSNQKVGRYINNYVQTNIHVNGLWRFKRHLGIGITASIPIRNGGKYMIITESGSKVNKYDINTSKYSWDYFYTESAKVAFNGRLYAGTKANFYVDGRISIFSFTEHLTLERATIEELEKNVFKQVIPGFSVGLQPSLSKNIFLNINLSWDFYKFKDVGFKNGSGPSSDTYYTPYSQYEMLAFKSQIPEKKLGFSANVGVGYFF